MERLATQDKWQKVATDPLAGATVTLYYRAGFSLYVSVRTPETRERCATYSESMLQRSTLCRGDWMQITRTE